MTCIQRPKVEPKYEAEVVKTEKIEGATCAHCGKPAEVKKSEKVSYTLQFGLRTRASGYREVPAGETYVEIWLRSTPRRFDWGEDKWIYSTVKEVVEKTDALRKEFRVPEREAFFVIVGGPNMPRVEFKDLAATLTSVLKGAKAR
jgi:hypothetical protein